MFYFCIGLSFFSGSSGREPSPLNSRASPWGKNQRLRFPLLLSRSIATAAVYWWAGRRKRRQFALIRRSGP